MTTSNGIAFTAKPKALAGPQSGIGASDADRSADSVAQRDRLQRG